MRIIRIVAIMLIGVLLLLSACAKPSQTPPPPTPTIPTTPEPVTPVTPPPVTPPPLTPPPVTPPPPPAVQGPYDVWIPGREFRPSILTVPVGTKVTWVSMDGEQHTVTSATGLFDASLAFGQSFSFTFTARGTYEYNCNPHPEMTGKVIVE